MPKACVDRIESSYQVALALLNDVDLRLLVHSPFGKGLMKKCRISPDAFIQMALQLAYYRVRAFSLFYSIRLLLLLLLLLLSIIIDFYCTYLARLNAKIGRR